MKLSIGILTHNEGTYVKTLVNWLVHFKQIHPRFDAEYEVVIVDDNSTEPTTLAALERSRMHGFAVHTHPFQQDFARQKNILTDHCSGDWVFNLDADEYVESDLLYNLPSIIESNSDVEAYWFPRKNVVTGLGLSHAQKWNWPVQVIEGLSDRVIADASTIGDDSRSLLTQIGAIINEENGFIRYYEPLVAWPDWQLRLYKNHPRIRWHHVVHERIEGYTHASRFPEQKEFAIFHNKSIDRQEQQNSLYTTMLKPI